MLAIAALYAVAAPNGVAARLSRAWPRERDEFQKKYGFARGLANASNLLFCRLFPLFYAFDMVVAVARHGRAPVGGRRTLPPNAAPPGARHQGI